MIAPGKVPEKGLNAVCAKLSFFEFTNCYRWPLRKSIPPTPHLKHGLVQCPHCGQEFERRIQFKFGATRQLEYKLGDTLAWGYNENGKPNLSRVKVYGILENDECPKCAVAFEYQKDDEFDIIVECDVLKSFSSMAEYGDYLVDSEAEGIYAVL